MKKSFLYLTIVSIICFFAPFASRSNPEASSKTLCPEWKTAEVINSWKIDNEALSCRSQCRSKQDCTSIIDDCGRVLIFNKSYSLELELLLKQLPKYECPNRFDFGNKLDLNCRNKKCDIRFDSCAQEREKLNKYISSKLSTKCVKDSDCTFFLSREESCVRRLPVTSSAEFQNHQLNLAFLNESVLHSCKGKNWKECDSSEKSFCITHQCVVLAEKPQFKNFLNLEGPHFIANYNSNTTPIKMPGPTQSKCTVDSDCSEILGVCSQYVVSLNKKFLPIFKADLVKMLKTIACAAAPKIQIPKSRCFKKFCSFVN